MVHYEKHLFQKEPISGEKKKRCSCRCVTLLGAVRDIQFHHSVEQRVCYTIILSISRYLKCVWSGRISRVWSHVYVCSYVRERERSLSTCTFTLLAISLFLFPGLTMHATILAYMFSLVEEGKIGTAIFNPASAQSTDNVLYMQEYVARLLKQAFPHLQE